MRNEIFQWLRTLRTEEYAAFDAYLQSVLPKKESLPKLLFRWLTQNPEHWADIDGEANKKEIQRQLQMALFPKKDFKPQRIRRVFMELRALLEGFIREQVPPWIDKQLDQELGMLKYFLERDASELFEIRRKKLEASLDQATLLSTDHYLASMLIEKMVNEFNLHRTIPEDRYEFANRHLAKYYLVLTLENFVAMRNRQLRDFKERHYLFETSIRAMLGTSLVENDPLIGIWKSVYEMLTLANPSGPYIEVSQQMEVIKTRLPLNTRRQIEGQMLNHLIKSAEPGNEAYYRRLWELIDGMRTAGTLHTPDGRMTFQFFLAAVRSACFCNEHEWARNFIGECSSRLVTQDREEQIQYSQLLVDYYAGKWHDTWHALLVFSPTIKLLELHARTLQVQIAYDLQKEDDFFRLVDALGKYIRRSEDFAKRTKVLALGFARFAKRIGHVRFVSHKLPKNLLKRLNATETSEKIWLRCRLEKLSLD